MKFVLIAVALLDDLRCGSKVGGAPRSGIGASGVGAVKETEICNLREFAMALLGTVVSGRRFSFSGQSLCRGDGRRERRFLDSATAAMPSRADTKTGGRFCMKRCGPSRRRVRNASAVLKNFVGQPKKTFSTVSACLRRDEARYVSS
jgi:hypothetical protein